MANEFTTQDSWRVGGPNDSLTVKRGILAIDTTASGGAAVDDLAASLFGFNKILACSPIVNDGEDKIFIASPDYTGDSLIVQNNDSSTNGLDDLPNDNYRLIITGY